MTKPYEEMTVFEILHEIRCCSEVMFVQDTLNALWSKQKSTVDQMYAELARRSLFSPKQHYAYQELVCNVLPALERWFAEDHR